MLVTAAVAGLAGCDRVRDNVAAPPTSASASAEARPLTTTEAANDQRSSEPNSAAWFHEVRDNGFSFTCDSGAFGNYRFPEITTGGIAIFDFDNDGVLDIYCVNGQRETSDAAPLTNKLFKQSAGGKFVDVTEQSGLGDTHFGMGVAIGDVDNDGDRDVLVTNYGPDQLYRNRGDGTFENVTAAAGIDAPGWSTSAAFFDYDEDGFLDLYICQYLHWDPEKLCYDMAGRRDYCGPSVFPGAHDLLFHNRGDGTFENVTRQAGIANAAGHGFGVVCHDFDDDNDLDLYVTNDGDANHLWINQGDGTFRDEAIMMGVALSGQGYAEAGMGVVTADFDADGFFDLFMTHLDKETNTFYRNLGSGIGFHDATGSSGLGTDSMPLTGFGTAAFDLELDGDVDLAVVNGRVMWGAPRRDAELPAPWNAYCEPNLLYRNDGAAKFVSACVEAGEFCTRVEVSRGLAVGDLDDDGDLDMVVTNLNSPVRLYRNDAPRRGGWLIVVPFNPALHRVETNAVVSVNLGGKIMKRIVSGGYSYLSYSPEVAHFGLGNERPASFDVQWRDGTRERFKLDDIHQRVRAVKGQGEIVR
ncbi:MAG: CRTAC1 family protein [Phycisphaerae bacterium]